jgi:hypothetical protein
MFLDPPLDRVPLAFSKDSPLAWALSPLSTSILCVAGCRNRRQQENWGSHVATWLVVSWWVCLAAVLASSLIWAPFPS